MVKLFTSLLHMGKVPVCGIGETSTAITELIVKEPVHNTLLEWYYGQPDCPAKQLAKLLLDGPIQAADTIVNAALNMFCSK